MLSFGRLSQHAKRLVAPNQLTSVCRALSTTAQMQGGGSKKSEFADLDIAKPPEIKPWGKEWVDQGWPKDGTGFKDYPNWAEWSHQDRDPNAQYDDQQMRRNFGEPIHFYDDGLRHHIYDSSDQKKYTPHQCLGHFCVCFALLGLMLWYDRYVYDVTSADPCAPKPYPFNNLYLESGGNPGKEPDTYSLIKPHPQEWYSYY